MMIQSSAPATEPRQRQRIDLEVTFIVDGQTGSGRAIDLSTGGIGITGSSRMLTVGTELDLTLRLPNSTTQESLNLRGMVCYHSDSRFGVRFLNLTFKDEKIILGILANG
jgi:PilZ domain-containing protein